MEAAGRRYIIHGHRGESFRLWNLSDLHWMSRACAEDEIRHDVAQIRQDPHSFWLGGGDYCDFIGYRDKRFDPDAVADWVPLKKLGDLGRYGMEQLRDLFRPIAHKCFGLLVGNHEKRYELATEQESLHAWLCTELGVPNLGYSCIFDVVFHRASVRGKNGPVLAPGPGVHNAGRSETFRVFAHHGAGYAQTPGGKLNRLIGFMQSFDADLYFIGHVHDHLARKEPALACNADCSKIVQRIRLGLIAGSYLKTYQQGTTTYGEQRGYRPTSLGAAVARVWPDTHRMEAVV